MPAMIAMRGHMKRGYEDTYTDMSPMESLSVAISRGKIATARRIVNQAGSEIQLNGALDHERGHTPLTLAAKHGHVDIVKFLIERGVDVEQRNACSDMTAVMYAMIERHEHVIDFLIGIGARVQDRNRYGWTAVMMAVMYGTADMLGCVLGTARGVDVSSDDCGKALRIAIAQGKAGHVSKLLDAGVNAHYRNRNHDDALELALKHGKEEIALMIAQKRSAVMAEE